MPGKGLLDTHDDISVSPRCSESADLPSRKRGWSPARSHRNALSSYAKAGNSCGLIAQVIAVVAFVFLVVPVVFAQGTISMGETAILSSEDNGNKGSLVAQEAPLSRAATVQSLSFYVTKAEGELRLGVFDSTGPNGGPGVKKAETVAFTPRVGWNTQSVTAPVLLPAGTYWLAFLPSSSKLTFRRQFSGEARSYRSAFGPLPATFSRSPKVESGRWSLYATLNPSSGGSGGGSSGGGPPVVSFTAAPLTILPGQSTALVWSATKATSCTASGGWSGSQPLAGDLLVLTASTATYTLTCTGPGGSTAKSVTVTVAGPARLTLTWVDNAAGNAIFKIERRIAAGGTYAQIATTSAGAAQYVDATPARGNTYCYRVRAWTAGGNSQYSNEACATL